MSQPTIYWREGSIGVFWDVDDYPIPEDLLTDPELVYKIIADRLRGGDYQGKLSIRVYKNNQFSDELVKKYQDAGFEMDLSPGETKRSRIFSMLVDILLWSFKNPKRANLILLTKNVGIDQAPLDILEGFYFTDYGVLLSDPEPHWDLACGSSKYLWKTLFYFNDDN